MSPSDAHAFAFSFAVIPIGVIVFPGTGIQDNLAGKARKMGIPVYRLGRGGA
jgi:hypothetical protein